MKIKTAIASLLVVGFLSAVCIGADATVISVQPTAGLNDGSDTGAALAGKHTGYANGPYKR